MLGIKLTKRQKINFLIGISISIASIVWVLYSVEKEKVFNQVRDVNWIFIIGAILVTFLSYFLRAARWPFFFKNQVFSLYSSFRCLIIGFAMNNFLPARMGEFVRAHVGGREAKISRTTVLATIAGERLADGLAISALFCLLFSFAADKSELANAWALFYVAAAFGLATIFTIFLLTIRSHIFVFLSWINSHLPGHLYTFALVRIRRFIEGLEPMLQRKRLIILTPLSIIIWLVELFVYYLVSQAFGQDLGIGTLSLFLAAVNFSSLIPSGPGAIGVIEAFATVALVHVGIERETALAMVATQHIIQIGVVGIPGAYFFFTYLGGRLPLEGADTDSDNET